jgi:hypothetical protein
MDAFSDAYSAASGGGARTAGFKSEGWLQVDTEEQCHRLISASPTKRNSASKSASWLTAKPTGASSSGCSTQPRIARTRKRKAAAQLRTKARPARTGLGHFVLRTGASISLSDSQRSNQSAVFGRRRLRQKTVQTTQENSDTTTANSGENWQCPDCGERATPDLVTPAEAIVLVVRCPVCGVRDEVPQGGRV